MRWNLIDSGLRDGKFNMDFDIFLANICTNDEAYFRLYRWDPYAISIGANQSFDDINIEKAKRNNIDVVKRPTGGRAILHSEELTYSLIIPVEYGLGAREIYNKTSIALASGLGIYNKKLRSVELESVQPNFRVHLLQKSGSLCFASTSKNEIKYSGKKLIGSAQRKMDKSILQHGSILCGKYHLNLPNFLSDISSTSVLTNELQNKTIEISTIINQSVDITELSQSIIKGFENEWKINFSSNGDSVLNDFERSKNIYQEA